MALIHLSSYLAHALVVLLLLVSLPMLLVPDSVQLPLSGLGLMFLGPPLVYAISQYQLYPDWGRRLLRAFPLLALIVESLVTVTLIPVASIAGTPMPDHQPAWAGSPGLTNVCVPPGAVMLSRP